MSVGRHIASTVQNLGFIAAALLIVALLLLSGSGYLFAWPEMDEGNYLLQARNIAQGLLPYRDFYDFITPGGQLLGGLWSRFYGFSILSLRLWVCTGWLLELFLIYDMGKRHIGKPWLILTLLFFATSAFRYPIFQHHFISGFLALLAVYCLWRYLQGWYKQGRKQKPLLVASGLLTAGTFWVTQSLGVLLCGALALFSLLHCFLHEREEKNLTYRQVSNKQVFMRWLQEWGSAWALPQVLVHAIALTTIAVLGLWKPFWRDTTGWLLAGHYSKTTQFGYYVTFHMEMARLLKPFADGMGLYFPQRIPQGFHLLWIGIMPIAGLLGVGYHLPQRFLYRLLRLEDEALLLWWLAALTMIVSTMSYSTSMHIVSNGALAYLLSGWAISYWVGRHLNTIIQRGCVILASLLGVSILIANIIGSLTILQYGTWLPPLPGLKDRLVYINQEPSARQFKNVMIILQQAANHGERVFIYNEKPSLYLAGTYRNATRFTIILPHYTSSIQIEEIIADLEKHRPRYILYDQTDRTLKTDLRFAAYPIETLSLPRLEHYIRERYVPRFQEGWWLIFERKED